MDHLRPLTGGSIAEVWSGRLPDDRAVVVKVTGYDARLEAEGLAALGDAGAAVPEVLAVDERVLVMTRVSGRPDWERLGATLADVHRQTGERFGWHRDNVIGSLLQRNAPSERWGTFFAERRIRPWLGTEALPSGLRRRLGLACDGPLQELVEHDPVPSLVHGDLWAGNVVDGCYLVDPAVHHADREFELAFAALFGGIPASFWRGYHDAWPLEEGWERRRPALQLYHLLVHVELFGTGYVGQVAERLDALEW